MYMYIKVSKSEKKMTSIHKVPSAYVKVTSTLQHDCCTVQVCRILLHEHENVSCKSRDFFGHTIRVSSALIEENTYNGLL